MSNLTWLLVALTATFTLIGGYIASLLARKRRVEDQLARLQQRGH